MNGANGVNRGLLYLHDAVSAVCPIDGISIGKAADKSTWRIDYKATATAAQRAAAAAIVASFDINAEGARRETFKTDARLIDLISRLKSATPAQISAWVDADVPRAVKAVLLYLARGM